MFVGQIGLWAKRLSHGFAQIMLQENWLTGLLFMLGIAVNSWLMLACAVVGSCSSMLAAMLCRVDTADLDRGLYSYNGALVGLAVSFYLPLSIYSVFILLFCAMLATVIQRLLISVRVSPLTGPFVLAGWVALLLAQLLGLNGSALPIIGNDLTIVVLVEGLLNPGVIQATSHGLGQVMFQGNVITGLLFIAGLAAAAPKVALWGVIGSVVGYEAATMLQYPEQMVAAGLFGFNGVLVAIVLSGRFHNRFLLLLGGIIMTMLFTRAFQILDIAPLTAPFVLTSWLIFLLDYLSRTAKNRYKAAR